MDLAPLEDVHPPVCCDWICNFSEWPWSRHEERQKILYAMYEETYLEVLRRVRENQRKGFSDNSLQSCMDYVEAQMKKARQIAHRAEPPLHARITNSQLPPQA